jgi:hypothetical protein
MRSAVLDAISLPVGLITPVAVPAMAQAASVAWQPDGAVDDDAVVSVQDETWTMWYQFRGQRPLGIPGLSYCHACRLAEPYKARGAATWLTPD